EPGDFEVEQQDGSRQIRCKYFETGIVEGKARMPIEDDSFHAVVCIRGGGEIAVGDKREVIKAGESLFIPAMNEVLKTDGDMSVVITKV
nr:hypothetical protein [Fretibacterium sp.]